MAIVNRNDFDEVIEPSTRTVEVKRLRVEAEQARAENARLRQQRDEAREGWAMLAGIAEEVAQQLEAKDSRVRRSWAAKELREAVETFGPKAAPVVLVPSADLARHQAEAVEVALRAAGVLPARA